MIDTSKSNSDEQQKAEITIGDRVEEYLACPLKRNEKVILAEGVHIVPDLYSEEDRIVGEIFAHIGSLKVVHSAEPGGLRCVSERTLCGA